MPIKHLALLISLFFFVAGCAHSPSPTSTSRPLPTATRIDHPTIRPSDSPTATRSSDPTTKPPPYAAIRPSDSPPPTSDPQAWMRLPVVPEISPRVTEVFALGQQRGNNPAAFSKVGDCGSTPT
ncbi:MAG: hypothetical protein PHS96_07285, partial [Anaerolineales bacterium]|nr:hypothetical protein [Anaerolineales bacterium]